jgi:cytochrome d ubiquinol oxidase subunit II
MKETIALVIPSFSLFIYIILSSIEFGSSFFTLFPKLIQSKNTINEYLNPVWETTNVFLVFALTSLFACFPGATARWGTDLFTITFITLAIFGVRVICILFRQYAQIKSRTIDIVYFLTSYLIPILFSLILLYFFTGSWLSHIKSPLYWWLALTTITCIFTMSSAFFRAYKRNELLTQTVRASGTLFLFASTIFLVKISFDLPYLFTYNHIETWIASLMILWIFGILITETHKAYVWVFSFFCLFIGTLFWGLFIAHLPYIVYPSTTITSSITNISSLSLIEGSFIVGMLILLPALFLLYKLFLFNKIK